jgi:pyrrolidone-carboxylate peptidase
MLYNLSMYQPISGVDFDFGFIHVPTRHEYAVKNPSDPDFMTKIAEWVMPSMEMSRMIKGIEVSLEECVRARAGE